jgi:tRNA (pseudouridine54-N1)-methyltransferase
MQITVLLDAPRTRTDEKFLIRDVPGTSGRLDVICRILIAAFRTVPELATSIQVNAVLGGPPKPPLLLQVGGKISTEFPESELGCALILKGLLFQYQILETEESNYWPQISISSKGFAETLAASIQPDTQFLYMVEKGRPLPEVKLNFDQPITLLLGDDQGVPPEHEEFVYQHPVQEVSIGTRSLLGSHVISLFLLEVAQRIKKQAYPP